MPKKQCFENIRAAAGWEDYELLDASDGERLERWGKYILARPDPTVIWSSTAGFKEESAEKEDEEIREMWENIDARYIRSDRGGGYWEYNRQLPESWEISYKHLRFKVKPTGFKHTGIFPEQSVNWDYCAGVIKDRIYRGGEVSVLNLFAYTGGATVACAAAGAKVCHLDAIKNIVEWGKDNARLSNLSEKPVRWIVDDAMKFLQRELKRGVRYDAVILDPPSYGRGSGNEEWKLQNSIYALMMLVSRVLSDTPLFVLFNCYTTGLSPAAADFLCRQTFGKTREVEIKSGEIGIPVKRCGYVLPCGCTAIVEFPGSRHDKYETYDISDIEKYR